MGVRLPPGALSPPRTLVATNDFPPRIGGVERFLVDLVRALPAGSVHVLAPDQPGARAVDRTIEAPVDRLPRARPGGLAPWRRRILDRLDTGGFEVVLIGQALPLGLLVSELADRGVPCVVLTHGVEYWLARLPGAAALLRRATEGARLVTAISTATATAIRSALPADLPVELLPPGVDVERFRPDVDASGVRERLGVDARPLVLCVSRVVRRKGFDVLVGAMPAILARVPDAVLALVGDGPDRRRIERLAQRSPARSAIRIVGAVSDVDLPAYHAAADVFAMPARSRWGGLEVEGFGIVYLEAAASGTPVVAGRSGGAAEAVVHGRTGVLVDGRDPVVVAGAVSGLLVDPPRRAAMARAARIHAEAFDRRAIAARLVGYLRTAVGQ